MSQLRQVSRNRYGKTAYQDTCLKNRVSGALTGSADRTTPPRANAEPCSVGTRHARSNASRRLRHAEVGRSSSRLVTMCATMVQPCAQQQRTARDDPSGGFQAETEKAAPHGNRPSQVHQPGSRSPAAKLICGTESQPGEHRNRCRPGCHPRARIVHLGCVVGPSHTGPVAHTARGPP